MVRVACGRPYHSILSQGSKPNHERMDTLAITKGAALLSGNKKQLF